MPHIVESVLGNNFTVMVEIHERTEFRVTVNHCSSARANKSSEKKESFFNISERMKMKFVADHSELVLLDFVHIPPSGD